MNKVKNLLCKLFDGITLRYCCKYVAVITGVVVFLELLMVCLAYCFGAKCIDGQVYEIAFVLFRVIFMVSTMLLIFSGIILCIALALFSRRLATLKLLIGLVVVFVELTALKYLIEPVSFYCLKGFVNHAPGKIDVEAVQNWLDNAELEPTDDHFGFFGYTTSSQEVNALNPTFISIYNHNNKRAIKLGYGNRATSTLFGIVIIGKDVTPAEAATINPPGRPVKYVYEHCYLWDGRGDKTPIIARILGLEIE